MHISKGTAAGSVWSTGGMGMLLTSGDGDRSAAPAVSETHWWVIMFAAILTVG